MFTPVGPKFRVRRIQVDEGFFDGLDLTFVLGLNVLIGPRGAGKTSIVELLRFSLGMSALTERMTKQAYQHAMSVLGSGRVTLTADVDGETIAVTRTADDLLAPPRWSQGVVILGQSEIEHVGLEERGRLALLDSFVAPQSADAFSLATSRVRSLTTEVSDLAQEIELLSAQLAERTEAASQLTLAEGEQLEVMQAVEATLADREELEGIQRALASSSTRVAVLERAKASLQSWADSIERTAAAVPAIEEWPEAANSEDLLVLVKASVLRARRELQSSSAEVTVAISSVASSSKSEQESRANLSNTSREIRQKLDQMQEGAGSIARRVTELRELAGQASALQALLDERTTRMSEAVAARRKAYGQLETLRQSRAKQRKAVGDQLVQSLGSKIGIDIGQSEGLSAYSSAIAGGLRGSGLHYVALAEALADQIGPLELAELVESGDAEKLSQAASIPLDRAARVLGALRVAGVEDIATAAIEDTVTMTLQVSARDRRPTERLSTGQRCTVILPIVLSRRDHPVVVDQPEDNLDNAYVADTVVAALLNRTKTDQFILATHNPNIPVLGEADQVVVLASDGDRGEVRSAAPLLDPRSISAISSIMEGGREAFERRALLYSLGR